MFTFLEGAEIKFIKFPVYLAHAIGPCTAIQYQGITPNPLVQENDPPWFINCGGTLQLVTANDI